MFSISQVSLTAITLGSVTLGSKKTQHDKYILSADKTFYRDCS